MSTEQMWIEGYTYSKLIFMFCHEAEQDGKFGVAFMKTKTVWIFKAACVLFLIFTYLPSATSEDKATRVVFSIIGASVTSALVILGESSRDQG